ncbi:M23 family metallopeptidase [Ferrovibrio terrae]|uniref:M23 family metallopeptidase n=1 Tax=Ferrovibrio terrae TaxID=2594003 RepID=A0A516GW98_9PROT|nr:M23 family metallopeptidase [Ferrovibrio terrae]QDO95807.1 M23 family metallopeptidase [Ferrovibrio terrae]
MRRWLAVLLLMAAGNVTAAEANEAPAGITWQGDFSQGGLVTGAAEPGILIKLNDRIVPVAKNGRFVFGFGRDESATMTLTVTRDGGRSEPVTLRIAPQTYDIQRIDGLPPAQVTPPPAVLERIRRENAAIAAVRQRNTARQDFLQGWIWPAKGPVSGVYGSQRILNGEPRTPHYGLDIAAPTGSPVVAPSAGEVVLAEKDIYFTGGTIIIDHGMGINSAFSHLHALNVKVGQQVKQGELIGTVGATGRATGPHLDWRVNWFDVRLDPQRLLPEKP